MKNTPYLDVFRAEFGRASKISRTQLHGLLVKLTNEAGLNVRDYAGWYGVGPDDHTEMICRAMANAPRGIQLLSLGGNVRDIQRDEPGSMNPSQMAEISFVSAELAKGDRDSEPGRDTTMWYLRQHASRVVVITGARLEQPSKEQPTMKATTQPELKPGHWLAQCDNGHKWQVPDASHPATLDQCPTCGEYWQ